MQRIAVMLLVAGLWSTNAAAGPCEEVGRVVGGFAGGATGYGLVTTLGVASNWVTAGLYGAGIAVGSRAGGKLGEIGCDRFADNWRSIGETYCQYSGFNYDCKGVNEMAASLYADFVVCPACTYGEVFGAFLLDDPSRQRWLRDIQYARKGYYSASAQVHPRPYIGSLSSSTANSFFIGVQAGLAMLRMDSTSMYVNLR